jgi:hypothetical protein
MALQVRRGTNAERLAITPLAGELIFTTDTKQLYVGDGTTNGGITSIANTIDSVLADTTPQLGGNLDLNGNSITGTGNINITGTITATGTINLGDGVGNDLINIGGEISGHLLPDTDIVWNFGSSSKQWKEAWINQLNVENQITASRVNASIIADDSSVLFDATTGTIPAGALTGIAEIDIKGSIFGNDSSPIVDGINRDIFSNNISISGITNTDKIHLPTETLSIQKADGAAGAINTRFTSLDDTSRLFLSRSATSDISLDNSLQYGSILFERNDTGGSAVTSLIFGSRNAILFGNDPTGAFSTESTLLVWTESKLGVGKNYPAEVLDVNGNANIDGFVQFGSLSTTERNALTAANGMVIYNSTNNRFEGYQNGGWINLDDGTAAA